MAQNLRKKISSSDTLIIHDVNPAVTEQFAQEVGNVTVAQNVREVAEKSVRRVIPFSVPRVHFTRPRCFYDDLYIFLFSYDLSYSESCYPDYFPTKPIL